MTRLILLIPMLAVALLWTSAHATQGSSAVPTLVPVDEAPRRPDFLAFRQHLRQVVARGDVPALLEILHPNIKNSFGGDDGIEAFKRMWKLDGPQTEVWRELGSVLALGGTFEGPDSFVAPYVFSRWPEKLDAFEHVTLIGSRVRIRSAPAAHAPVLETLSHAILRLGGNSYPQRPWTAVKLPDGRAGFVAAHLVRSPIDYRASFNRVDGRWQMTLFLSGD